MENFNTNIQFYSLTYMHQQKTTCLKRHKSAHKCMYKMYKDVYKSMQCKKKNKITHTLLQIVSVKGPLLCRGQLRMEQTPNGQMGT